MTALARTKEFIAKSIKYHGNLYDYAKSEYINSTTKLIVICRVHGEFLVSPSNHLRSGCSKCQIRKKHGDIAKFMIRAKELHGDLYDYSLVTYRTHKDKIRIICPHHGIFIQTVKSHLHRTGPTGCPSCRSSRGEDTIKVLLLKSSVKFTQEKTFSDCVNELTGKKLRYDFYLDELNTLIEFDGKQHFIPCSFGGSDDSLQRLKETIHRDAIKTAYAARNGIKLIRIPYTEYHNIPTLLSSIL